MDNNESLEKSPPLAAKKVYEKPSFRYEEVFVTTALGCSKFSITQPQCGPGKVS